MTPSFVRTHWLGTSCNMDSSSVGARWQDETSTKHNWLTNAHDAIASSLQRHRHGPQTEIWRHPQNRKYTYTPYHYADKGGPSHGHWQHAQKLVKIWRVVLEICSWRDRQTDRHAHRCLTGAEWSMYTRTYTVLFNKCADVFIVTQRRKAAGQIRFGTLQTLADIERDCWKLLQWQQSISNFVLPE